MNATELHSASGFTLQFQSCDENAMGQVASALAARCRMQDCILLNGEVGAGKTTFARAFVRALCPDVGEVVSPTFMLLQSYPLAGGGSLSHFDLYRVRGEEELQELGLDDALDNGITLIEWPDIARRQLPPTALDITIHHMHGEDKRQLELRSPDHRWQERLRAIGEAL